MEKENNTVAVSYEAPRMDVIEVETENTILASPGVTTGQVPGYNPTTWD
jgi:hypothetical protein